MRCNPVWMETHLEKCAYSSAQFFTCQMKTVFTLSQREFVLTWGGRQKEWPPYLYIVLMLVLFFCYLLRLSVCKVNLLYEIQQHTTNISLETSNGPIIISCIQTNGSLIPKTTFTKLLFIVICERLRWPCMTFSGMMKLSH